MIVYLDDGFFMVRIGFTMLKGRYLGRDGVYGIPSNGNIYCSHYSAGADIGMFLRGGDGVYVGE
jgi:hypothetical protein